MASNKTIKLNVHAEINLPNLPNYIRYGPGDSQMMDVAEFTDEQLEEAGEAWTKELVAHAQRRRKKKVEELR